MVKLSMPSEANPRRLDDICNLTRRVTTAERRGESHRPRLGRPRRGRRFLRADGSWHRLGASAPITADTAAQSCGPAGERRFQTNANRIKKRTLALRCQRGCQRRAPALENRVFSPLIEASFPEGRSSLSAPPH